MRSMTRNVLAGLAVMVLSAGSTALADVPFTVLTDYTSHNLAQPAPVPESSVFETFEAFNLGQPNQFGWTPSGTSWTVTGTNPIAGTRALLHTPNGPNLAQRVFSPATAASFGIQAALVRIDAVGAGASYGLELQGAGAAINARVLFMDDGDIEVLQAPGGVGTFVDTGVNWILGTPVQVGIDSLADGSQKVYLDGVLAFTGLDINFQVNNLIQPPTTANSVAFIGTALTSRAQMDNFSTTLVPEPATLGLLVLSGGILLRRRK